MYLDFNGKIRRAGNINDLCLAPPARSLCGARPLCRSTGAAGSQTYSAFLKSDQAAGATGISKSIWRRSRLCLFLLLAVTAPPYPFSKCNSQEIRRSRAYERRPCRNSCSPASADALVCAERKSFARKRNSIRLRSGGPLIKSSSAK